MTDENNPPREEFELTIGEDYRIRDPLEDDDDRQYTHLRIENGEIASFAALGGFGDVIEARIPVGSYRLDPSNLIVHSKDTIGFRYFSSAETGHVPEAERNRALELMGEIQKAKASRQS